MRGVDARRDARRASRATAVAQEPREILEDRFARRGQAGLVVRPAPGRKVLPVHAVGAQCRFAERRICRGSRGVFFRMAPGSRQRRALCRIGRSRRRSIVVREVAHDLNVRRAEAAIKPRPAPSPKRARFRVRENRVDVATAVVAAACGMAGRALPSSLARHDPATPRAPQSRPMAATSAAFTEPARTPPSACCIAAARSSPCSTCTVRMCRHCRIGFRSRGTTCTRAARRCTRHLR